MKRACSFLAVASTLAFADDASAMLQMSRRTKKDRNETAMTPRTEPMSIWFDGETPTETIRQAFDGPANEQIYRFKQRENKGAFEVNESHVILKLGEMTHGQFVRQLHAQDNHCLTPGVEEHGIANVIWAASLPAPLMPASPVVGSVEKLHTMDYKASSWRTDSWNHAVDELGRQEDEGLQESVKQSQTQKTELALKFIMAAGVGNQMMRTAADPLAIQQAMALAGLLVSDTQLADFRAGMEATLAKLDRKARKNIDRRAWRVRRGRFQASAVSAACHHLSDFAAHGSDTPVVLHPPGSDYDTATHAVIRRGVVMTSWDGNTMSYPLEQFSFQFGASVVDVDPKTGDILFYKKRNVRFEASDPDGTHLAAAPITYIGSINGEATSPLGPDFRAGSQEHYTIQERAFIHSLWEAYSALPMNFEQFNNRNCTEDARLAAIAAVPIAAQTVRQLLSGAVTDTAEKLRLMDEVAQDIASHSGCFANVLAAPVADAHGWGFNQALVILHFMMEYPDSVAHAFVHPEWDRMV